MGRPKDNRPRGQKPPSGRGGGYKSGDRNRGGTPHGGRGRSRTRPPGKSSSSVSGPIAGIVYVLVFGVVVVAGSVIAFLAHGYGVF